VQDRLFTAHVVMAGIASTIMTAVRCSQFTDNSVEGSECCPDATCRGSAPGLRLLSDRSSGLRGRDDRPRGCVLSQTWSGAEVCVLVHASGNFDFRIRDCFDLPGCRSGMSSTSAALVSDC
jgi:hypothetical protein